MESSAPLTPLRRLLEDRFSEITRDVENSLAEARERARSELADQINQAVRRITQAADAEELAATLSDTAAAFADGAALFRIEEGNALVLRVCGVTEETAERLRGLRIPLGEAGALAGAVASREPTIAASTRTEVSPALVERLGHQDDGRVSIFPVAVKDRVEALLYAWGTARGPILELLAQVGGAVWSNVTSAPAPDKPELVHIAATQPAPAWESLPAGEQQAHLRAQRFARARVAEIRLREGDTVQRGRAQRNLYAALRQRIEEAREAFRREFIAGCPSMVDYLHRELVRTLANEDGDALGKEYPGPMA